MVQPPFVTLEPKEDSPVLVEVPHAGTWMEAEAAQWSAVRVRCIAFDADLYVDELFDEAPALGATLIWSRATRYVIDLNVAPREPKREVLGVPRRIRRRSASGRAWTEELPPEQEEERRLQRFFHPYHAAIRSILDRKRERFGLAVLVCAHSYPDAMEPEAADIVVGTRGDTCAAPRWAACLEEAAREADFSAARDDPYPGGYAVARYGAPSEGTHAVQLELRRSIYMNVDTLARGAGFEKTRRFATHALRRLVEVSRRG